MVGDSHFSTMYFRMMYDTHFSMMYPFETAHLM